MRTLALALCLAATAAAAPNRGSHIAPSGGLSKHIPNLNAGRVTLSYLPTIATSDECTGTSPATIQGGSLTFTRASSGYCTKTDGTLVLLSSNQPRVQPAGLLVEPAATNKCIRSQELDDGAWTPTNAVSQADNAFGPDGSETAETLIGGAAGGFIESTAAALTGAAAIVSVYVKTSAGTQAMAIRLRDTTAGTDACTGTLTATTTWQRVKCLGLITTGNSHSVKIYPGGTAGTGTVDAWGAMMEVTGDGSASARASSYVATAGTSVARALDNARLALPTGASEAAGCIGVTISTVTMATVPNQRFLDFDASNPINHNSSVSVGADDGVASPGNLAISNFYTNTNRVTFNWSGTVMYLQSAAATGTSGTYGGNLWTAANLYIGGDSGTGTHAYASLSDIKFGTRPGVCL